MSAPAAQGPTACIPTAFVGTRLEGDTCQDELFACAPGLACGMHGMVEGPGADMAPPVCRQLCDPLSPAVCDTRACASLTMPRGGTIDVCDLPPGDPGEACSPSMSHCGPGTDCLQVSGDICGVGVQSCCISVGMENQPCYSDGHCDPGLACANNHVEGWQRCVPSGSLGEVCGPEDSCEFGLSCQGDVIQCPSDGSAGGGRCCLSGGTMNWGLACAEGPQACADGLSCATSEECPLDLSACCLPASTGGEDEACGASDVCNEGLSCVAGCANGLPACCKPGGGENEVCGPSGACDDGLACARDPACGTVGNGTCCRVSRADGQPCNVGGRCGTANLGCLSGAICDGLDQCCKPAGGEDQACLPGPMGSDRCQTGLTCTVSTSCVGLCECCKPAGGVTELCYANNTCDTTDLRYVTRYTNLCSPQQPQCCVAAGQAGLVCRAENTCDGTLLCQNQPSCAAGLVNCCM